jgi:hypothetical protein
MARVDGERRVPLTTGDLDLPEGDETVRLAVGERPQQDAVHDGEHRRRGAEGERERGDDGRRI